MTTKKEDDVYVSGEPEIVAMAEPTKQEPIPSGHQRFYCSKCQTPYDLPDKATSWRCSNCLEFNSITPGECEWCTIQ